MVLAGSGVAGGLVGFVAGRLELEGAVLHVEVAGQATLELVQQFGQVAVFATTTVSATLPRRRDAMGMTSAHAPAACPAASP